MRAEKMKKFSLFHFTFSILSTLAGTAEPSGSDTSAGRASEETQDPWNLEGHEHPSGYASEHSSEQLSGHPSGYASDQPSGQPGGHQS